MEEKQRRLLCISATGHFIVACSVTWPMNVIEAGGDSALIHNLSAFLI